MLFGQKPNLTSYEIIKSIGTEPLERYVPTANLNQRAHWSSPKLGAEDKHSKSQLPALALLKRKLSQKKELFQLTLERQGSPAKGALLGKEAAGRNWLGPKRSGKFIAVTSPLKTNNYFKIKTVTHSQPKAIQLARKETPETPPTNPEMNSYRALKPFDPHFITSKNILPIGEHAAMKAITTKGSPGLVLVGGLGNGINEEVILCQLPRPSIENVKFKERSQTSYYGHTIEAFHDKEIVVFGGDFAFRKPNKNIEVGKQVIAKENFISVNLETRETRPLAKDAAQKPKMRKFHASCVFDGSYLFIFGGMKMNYKFLSDFWVFDLETEEWHSFEVSYDLNPFLLYGLAHHKLAAVSSAITKLSEAEIEEPSGKASSKKKAETSTKSLYILKSHKKQILFDIYLFGGLDEHNQLLDNKLWQLGMIDRKFCLKEVPASNGFAPAPRHSHTMDACPMNKQLIVVGGRTLGNKFLGDVNVFSLTTKSWENFHLADESLRPGIAGHCSEIWENCLFIYGGISKDGFRSSDILYFSIGSASGEGKRR